MATVPNYRFLNLLGVVITVLGVLMLVGSLVTFLVVFAGGMQESKFDVVASQIRAAGGAAGAPNKFPAAVLMAGASGVVPFVLGLLQLAAGQAILAFRDIARNSWAWTAPS